MKAEQQALQSAQTHMSCAFVAKTAQELRAICANNPAHPVAVDLVKAVEMYPDDVVCHVLPVSIQAVTENRNVVVTYAMEQTPTGFQRVKKILLGESREVAE